MQRLGFYICEFGDDGFHNLGGFGAGGGELD
jgi:hypothetical protein